MLKSSNRLQICTIADRNGVRLDTPVESLPIEAIQDDKYLEYSNQMLYPPRSEFNDIYKLWLKHQSCFWSVHENDPSVDAGKFGTAPEEFQRILLCAVGCIMIGDSIVLDHITNNMLERITSIETKAMLVDQEARELIHKAMYSRMLDVSPLATYYRSNEFRKSLMEPIEKLAKNYRTDDIRIQMFFIMMCELILFAPLFQTICYTATKGYAPKLCDLNLLAMRDEFIHYEHARLQSSKFKVKIDFDLAREIVDVFTKETLKLFKEIVRNYDDGLFNFDHVHKHVMHVVHGFLTENDLYRSVEEFNESETLYGSTPANFYMNLPKCESKINRMEANSTIYAVPGDRTNLIRPKFKNKFSTSSSSSPPPSPTNNNPTNDDNDGNDDDNNKSKHVKRRRTVIWSGRKKLVLPPFIKMKRIRLTDDMDVNLKCDDKNKLKTPCKTRKPYHSDSEEKDNDDNDDDENYDDDDNNDTNEETENECEVIEEELEEDVGEIVTYTNFNDSSDENDGIDNELIDITDDNDDQCCKMDSK